MGGRRARMVGIAVAAACAVVAAVLVLVLDVGGGGGGGGGGGHGGKGGGRTANLWVSRSVGSCMRSPEPAPYDAATACSFPEALAFSEGGDRVLIRDGSYKAGPVTDAKPAPGVTFKAENPGKVSITGAISVTGAWLTFEDLVIHGAATLGPGASNITFRQDRITGEASAYGEVGNPSGPGSWIQSEISNRGGNTEHDITRCWINCRGLTYRDNLIRVREECPDCHNDGFRSFGAAHGIRYIGNRFVNDVDGAAGNGGAGFFMKDGRDTNVEFSDNLIVNRPAGNGGFANPFQVYDLRPDRHDPFYTGYGLKMQHNTIRGNGSISSMRDCQGSNYLVQRNVLDGLTVAPDTDQPSCIGPWVAANLRPHQAFNVIKASGPIGSIAGSRDKSSTPIFVRATDNDHGGDWRLASKSPGYGDRAGITWDPEKRVYGPR